MGGRTSAPGVMTTDTAYIDYEEIRAVLQELATTPKAPPKTLRATLVVRPDKQYFGGGGVDGMDLPHYSYSELLARVYSAMPASGFAQPKLVLKAPQMSRVGGARVGWDNFKDTCSAIGRDPAHVQTFFATQLDTTANVAKGGSTLVLKGRLTNKQMEDGLRKYMEQYVACAVCGKTKTALEKDKRTKLVYLLCSTCGARRSVPPIVKGYHATNRRDRRAARATE
jgi:translation initiation factor 2 subunit 2